ncbi:MAG: PPC domain-containing protein [Deltaproteobacteria bacterium]|nr:PPC domain-containing protein [Deltaproteobacteria bacterium]
MKRLAYALAAVSLAAPACTSDDPYAGEEVKSDDGKADSSALGVFLDATFDGKLVVDSSWDDNQTIQDQLLYTVGQLNGMTAVGRIDKAEISNVQKTTVNGKTQITYTAKLPIIWNKHNTIPATIDLELPLDVSYSGQDAFATKYKANCVDFGAHDVDSGSMFYYFRPKASGCQLAAADVHATSASLAPSPTSTTGKFPEYDKVWEDGTLNVVAIFGKYEDGATTESDAGISGYDEFVGAMKSELASHALTTVPANVATAPGVTAPDVEFNATLADGKKIHVVALLTDNVNKGLQDPTFRARYESLSTHADFIVYNGHAGLGSNIRALASAGKWVAGQYVVVFMNGCDTFAYIDGSLSAAHKAVNPDDTTGWKYIDIVNNGEPAFFASMAGATMSMFRGLLSYDNPQTYEQIFTKIDSSQLVMVTGEQDNAFTPGAGGQPQPWAGLHDQGSLTKGKTKSWTTPTLAAGTYQFDMTGTGDADLYVKVGSAPTTTSYDCRPYKTGSNESCKVTLAQPTTIGVMVRGYATSASSFTITGAAL